MFLDNPNFAGSFEENFVQCFFPSTLGLGLGPLELGKLATILEIWEISHFNKPFLLKVCLSYIIITTIN